MVMFGFLMLSLLLLVGMVQFGMHARDQAVEDFRRTLQSAGEPVGLTVGGTGFPTLSGSMDGIRVEFDRKVVRAGNSSVIYYRGRAWADVHGSVGLTPEGMLTGFITSMGFENHRLGDDHFDSMVRIRGDEASCRAALSKDARDAFLAAMIHDVEVADGCVTVQTTEKPGAKDVRKLLDQARALAAALECCDLGTVARDDPHPTVRAHALRVMAETDLDGAVGIARARLGGRDAVEALGAGIDDVVAAALVLGKVGTPSVVAALRTAASRVGDGAVGAQVERSVAAIQSRVGDAAMGGLSTAGGQEGGLTRAEPVRE